MAVVSTQTKTVTTPSAPGVKPKLRGWLHAGMFPVMLVAGLALIIFAPTLVGRIGTGIYLLTALQLFGMSAIYHRGNWSPEQLATFRRIDHSNIFIFIAGTYTPLCLTLLEGNSRLILLILIWSIGIAGVFFRIFWLSAPRWLYSMLYVAMGWVALWWLPTFWVSGGPVIVLLLIAGGVIYSLGAVAYAAKKPNPNPEWFGFHEVFHSATILAALCHYTAIVLAIFS
ncbi:MAG: hemolysin [Propionibacterium sp.]|nr:MAG: hemolysin [Propionibacterium sp.]